MRGSINSSYQGKRPDNGSRQPWRRGVERRGHRDPITGGHTDTRFLLHWMGCAAQISNEMRRSSGAFVKSLDLRFRVD